jgi:hypothetical protein
MLSPGSFALDFHRSRDTTMGTAWERTPWHAGGVGGVDEERGGHPMTNPCNILVPDTSGGPEDATCLRNDKGGS